MLWVYVTSEQRRYLYWLSAEDDKALCALGQETRKLMGQDPLDLIRLLNGNAETQRVDRSLDQNTLLVVTADDHRVEKNFLGCSTIDRVERKC